MSSFNPPPDSGVAALIRARQNIEAEPDSVQAHFDHALALCQLAQWEPAIAAWHDVTRLDPDNAFAYINMGVVHLEQAQWPEAEHAFEQAVRIQPDQAAAHYGMGVVRAQQGRLDGADGARSAWEHALVLAPNLVQAREGLAELNALGLAEPLPPVECVVTSQIHMQPPLPSARAERVVSKPVTKDTPAAQNPGAALSEPEPATSARQRIKIPPAVGPSLVSIADAVIAAQHTVRPDAQEAGVEAEQDSITPTLRLNTADVRAGHRRLSVAANLSRPQQFLSSLPGRVLLGAGAVGLLAVMVQTSLQTRRSPEPSTLNASVTPAVLPVAASAPPVNADPVAAASLTVTPVAAASVTLPAPRPDTANALASNNAEQAQTSDQSETQARPKVAASDNDTSDATQARPHPRPAPAHPRHARTIAADAPEPSHRAIVHSERAHPARSMASNSDETPSPRTRATARALPKLAAAQRRSHSGEEDTFSASAAASHSSSSDEWTDKPPQ